MIDHAMAMAITIAVALGPPTPEAAVALIAEAHAARAIEITSTVPIALHADASDEWRRRLTLAPGVVSVTDEKSGIEAFRYFSVRAVYDGNNLLRIDQRHMVNGGPSELTTDVTVFGPDAVLTRNTVNARRVGLARLTPDSVVHANLRARATYPTLVRFALSRLGSGRAVLSSQEGGTDKFALDAPADDSFGPVRLIADSATGEVVEIRTRDSASAPTTISRFVGRMTGAILPAHFPKERRNYILEPSAAFDSALQENNLASIEFYESATVLAAPPSDEVFDWRSLAPECENLGTGEVVTRSGRPPSKRTQPLRPEEAKTPVEFTDPATRDKSAVMKPMWRPSTVEKFLYAASIACVIAGLGLWLSRRWAKGAA